MSQKHSDPFRRGYMPRRAHAVHANQSIHRGLAAAVSVLIVGFATPAVASKNDPSIERANMIRPELLIRGVIRPAAQATISTELTARITRLPFRAGERFRSGDVLVAFDCERQFAELAALKAQRREMMVSYRSAAALMNRNVGSRQDVGIARARLDRATANLKALSVRLKQCEIIAPYDGSIIQSAVHKHERARAGKPLLSIVSTSAPEVELIVPARRLEKIKPGAEFKFKINGVETAVTGIVTRTSAMVDAVSQTFKVYGRFSAPSTNVIPGMSGKATFPDRRP